MPERARPILETLTAVGGASMLVVIGQQVRRRFWHTSAGRHRTPGDYAVAALLALSCALLWALSYVSLKFLSGHVAALPLSAGVLGTAALFLLCGWALARKLEGPQSIVRAAPPRRLAPRMALLCLANLGNFGLSIYALYFVSATQAMTLSNVSPLFLAALLLVRRKLLVTPGSTAALVVSLLGAWLLTAHAGGNIAGDGASLWGSLLALAAGASFALWADVADDMETRMRSMSTRFGVLASVFSLTFAVAALAAWVLAPVPSLSAADAAIIAANGLRVAVVYILFQLAVRRGGPLLAVVVATLQVPLTLLFEALWLDVALDRGLLIGVAGAVAGTIALSVDQAEVDGAPPRSGARGQ
jgi:drug/metabolite transporter (DMT)-like permease